MRGFVFTSAKALALALIAAGVGTGIAMAVNPNNDSYYNNSIPAAAGGNLVVKAGDGGEGGILQVGPSASQNVQFLPNVFGVPGLDVLNFGTGDDQIQFGSEFAAIVFESAFGGTPNDDVITYTPGAGATDDTLQIRSDDIVLLANNGDVVIKLGY